MEKEAFSNRRCNQNTETLTVAFALKRHSLVFEALAGVPVASLLRTFNVATSDIREMEQHRKHENEKEHTLHEVGLLAVALLRDLVTLRGVATLLRWFAWVSLVATSFRHGLRRARVESTRKVNEHSTRHGAADLNLCYCITMCIVCNTHKTMLYSFSY